MSLVSVVCCEVEVSATAWRLVQRSPNECSVSECDREVSITMRPWPTRGCCAMGEKMTNFLIITSRNYQVTSSLSGPTCRLSTLRLKVPIFWDMTPCRVVNRCHNFCGTCCVNLQNVDVRTVYFEIQWSSKHWNSIRSSLLFCFI
jgi:hypothetical protein